MLQCLGWLNCVADNDWPLECITFSHLIYRPALTCFCSARLAICRGNLFTRWQHTWTSLSILNDVCYHFTRLQLSETGIGSCVVILLLLLYYCTDKMLPMAFGSPALDPSEANAWVAILCLIPYTQTSTHTHTNSLLNHSGNMSDILVSIIFQLTSSTFENDV